MFLLELAHDNAWANRLEDSLQRAYPSTLWLLLQHKEHPVDDPWCSDLPWHGGLLPQFRRIALSVGTPCYLYADVPFTLLVDEEVFALVVMSLRPALERRPAAMVGEG